MANTIFHTQP